MICQASQWSILCWLVMQPGVVGGVSTRTILLAYGKVAPWFAPEFIKFRMKEYVDKKLKSVCAYVLPNNVL